jgi:Na+-driven multidrug efflux pump
MLRGVIKAMNLQKICAIINISGHWALNFNLMLILGFYFKLRLLGLWISKFVLEIIIVIAYQILINIQNWKEIEKDC